jgi:polar amino acid transport system substrate-binding protein
MLFTSMLARAEAIILANGEWPPFLSSSLPEYGFASHIVSQSFKEVGVDDEFAYFSEPVLQLNEVLFSLKKHPLQWSKIEDLSGLEISLALGSTPGIFKQPIAEGWISLIRTKDIESGFRMLLSGRIDACPVIDSVGHYLLRTKFSQEEREKIMSSVKYSEVVYYRLMLSKSVKENKQLMVKFNQGLKALKDSGRYARMEKDFYSGKYD